MTKKLLLSLTFVAFILQANLLFAQLPCDNTCSVNALIEQELCGSGANDDCANAELIKCGDIVCGSTYNGGVNSTFDTDWYKFTVTQQQAVTFSLNGATSFFFSLIDNCVDQNIIDLMANQPCTPSEFTVNLQPGTYYINVFPNLIAPGSWNCFNAQYYSFKITCQFEDPVCDMEVIADPTNPTCSGQGNDGSISLFIINGQPLYDVVWDNGSSDLDLFDLTAGTYCYTVTDGLGCSVSDCVILSNNTCSAPENVIASSISNTKATISWAANSCALKYRLQIRPLGSGAWTTYFINGGTLSKQLTNLLPGTTYQYRVRSVCSPDGSNLSAFSPTQTFTTTGCEAPGSPAVNILSADQVEVLWNTVAGVSKYRIRYRPVGTSTWLLKIVPHPQNSAILSNLTAATTYEYQLFSVCTDGSNLSQPTTLSTFTTNEFRTEENAVGMQAQLYPNPTTGLLTIQVQNTTTVQTTLEVYDVLGKQIQAEQITLNRGVNTFVRNYSSLSKGVYFIRISNSNNTTNIKFVKE